MSQYADDYHHPAVPAQGDISDIAGLFLSGMRERAREALGGDTGSAAGRTPPPRRIPPGGTAEPAIAQNAELSAPPAEASKLPSSVWVLVAPHVPEAERGRLLRGVLSQISQRASNETGSGIDPRVGVLRLSVNSASLALWDPELGSDEAAGETGSARDLQQAITELSCEIGNWVICVGTGDGALVGEVISAVARDNTARRSWVVPVLSGGDGGGDGGGVGGGGEEEMVAAYRTVKTLASISPSARGRLVLACAGTGEQQGLGWANKLRGVMRKFLAWEPADALVLTDHDSDASNDSLHEVMRLEDHASLSDLWEGVLALVESPAAATVVAETPSEPEAVSAEQLTSEEEATEEPEFIAIERKPEPVANAQPAPATVAPATTSELRLTPSEDEEATEVVAVDRLDAESVLEALARAEGLRPLDIRLPRSAGQRLRLMLDPAGTPTLLAGMASPDTDTLLEVGKSLAWLRENADLVAQLARLQGHSVSAEALPTARLYVARQGPHLASLLAESGVRVILYRPLRWGEQRAVLLERAA